MICRPAKTMCDRIKINIGGQLFVTKRSTLQIFPDTKLANITRTCEYFDRATGEYYYDRNPMVFQSILDYYRTGKLHFNSNICAQNIREELEFWEVTTADLEPCCWKYFYTVDNVLSTVAVIEKHFFQKRFKFHSPKLKVVRIKDNIWNILEHPKTSTVAFIWQLFYLAVVFLAIISVVWQSFEISKPPKDANGRWWKNSTMHMAQRLMDHDDWVLEITHLCNVIFAIETSLRFLTCPSKCEFIKGFLNVIDIISATGYIISVIILAITDTESDYDSVFVFAYLLAVLRGFRFYRIERFSEGLRLMLLSIKQSKKMLFVLILILLITSLVFGIMIHVMEMDGKFADPMSCFYWAVITMTTIGYGDIYPRSIKGKIIASTCATVGLFLLAMPIAVVANIFNDLNNRYTEHQHHIKQQNGKMKRKTSGHLKY